MGDKNQNKESDRIDAPNKEKTDLNKALGSAKEILFDIDNFLKAAEDVEFNMSNRVNMYLDDETYDALTKYQKELGLDFPATAAKTLVKFALREKGYLKEED